MPTKRAFFGYPPVASTYTIALLYLSVASIYTLPSSGPKGPIEKGYCQPSTNFDQTDPVIMLLVLTLLLVVIEVVEVVDRAAGIARLPRSLLDPELFPHTAYVKILATLARKTVN